jgi:hypothetical protein
MFSYLYDCSTSPSSLKHGAYILYLSPWIYISLSVSVSA